MKVLTRFITAPHRPIQVAIWLLLAAVLSVTVPAVADLAGPGALASTPVQQVAPLTIASEAPIVLADGAPAAGSAVTGSVDDPIELLPAYRWHDDLELPEDLGTADVAQGKSLITMMAQLTFTIAGAIWWVLLELMNFAMSMDVVSTFAGAINSFFATTYSGLSGVGIPALIGIFIALAAAVAASKGKLNDGVRMGISGLLVLGLLQTLGTAAVADRQSSATNTGASTSAPPAGTPAWLAVTGNEYVNDLAAEVSTLFGATAGITADVRGGGADGGLEAGGGATCSYYVQRLYSTYNAEMADRSKSTAAAMSMVSYMWQRSMYDTYTQAAFGIPGDGGRVACHQLERAAGISPSTQQAIAGSTVASSPYAGIATGPFTIVGDKKKNQASEMAWAVCKDSTTFNAGWDKIKHFEGAKGSDVCGKWWNDKGGAGLTEAVSGALGWSQYKHLIDDTIGKDPESARMAEVKTFVESYWGHNSGQRFMAGSTALLTAGLYGYAFGGPAIGVLLSQFVLLFMLILLPWSLIMLALPGKGGARNGTGLKLIRLTGMAFGGKLLFLVVLGVTLTLMSALFSLTMQGKPVSSYSAADTETLAAGLSLSPNMATFWSVLVPIATIVAMRFLLKGAGLGNLMGINGAMGFATAALKQGRDGKWASQKMGAAAAGSNGKSKIQGTLTKGKKALSSGAGKMGTRLTGSAKAGLAGRAINKEQADGRKQLDKDLAEKVVNGKMSTWEAKRHQRLRSRGENHGNGPLPDALATRVSRGELTHGAARRLHAAQVRRSIAETQHAAKRQGISGVDALDRAADRAREAAATPNESVNKPVHHAGQLKSAEAIEQDLTMRRAGLGVASANAKGETDWYRMNTEQLAVDGETLISNTRLDGSSDALTLAQTVAATAHARATVPEQLHGNLLVGRTGAPPVVLPSIDRSGHVALSARDLADPKVAVHMLSNPLNYLDPQVVERRPDEDDDTLHARLNLTMLETGLMDTQGNVADMLATLGIDRAKEGWEDQAVELALEMKSQGALKLIDRFYEVDPGQQDRINGATYQLVSTTPAILSGVDASGGTLANIVATANDSTRQAAEVDTSLERAMAQMDLAISTPRELDKATNALLEQVEMHVPAAMSAVLGVQLRSHALAKSVVGADFDVDAEHAALKAVLENERRNIAEHVARIKLTGTGSNRDELLSMAQSVRNGLRSLVEAQTTALDHAQLVVDKTNGSAVDALRSQLNNYIAPRAREEPTL